MRKNQKPAKIEIAGKVKLDGVIVSVFPFVDQMVVITTKYVYQLKIK